MPEPTTLATDAAVIRSLLEGEGIIDLRPTTEHFTVGARLRLETGGPAVELKPAYRALADLSPPAQVAGWVEVVGTGTVRVDHQAIDALNGKTVRSVAAMAGEEVQVVALRAHRLAANDEDGEPALSDGAFEAKLQALAKSVPGFTR